MAIDIGDAILTFLADTTQLDAALNKVGTETAAKMAPAQAALGGLSTATTQFGVELDATGENVAYAGSQIVEHIGHGNKALHEAKGEAHLLGEMFGIHLPRHVRSFIAEIPAVQTVLASAFAATAILFLIEALAKGIEKLIEFSQHQEKVDAAWLKAGVTFQEVDNKIQGGIDKQKEKLIELTQGPIAALEFELKHLGNVGLAAFDEIDKALEEVSKALKEAGSTVFTMDLNSFAQANTDLKQFREEMKKVALESEKEFPNDPIKQLSKQLDAVNEKIRTLDIAIGPGVKGVTEGFEKERDAAKLYAIELGKLIEKEQDRAKILKAEEGKKAEEEAKKAAAAQEKIEKMHAEFDKRVLKARQDLLKQFDKEEDEQAKRSLALLIQQGKEAEKKSDEELNRLIQNIKGQEAAIDGEFQHEQALEDQKAIMLKTQYDRGLITGQEYLEKLKALYAGDAGALQAILTRKQALVVQEAIAEAAMRGNIMTEADAKELKEYVDLENRKRKITDDYTNKVLHQQDQIDKRQARSVNTANALLSQYEKKLRESRGELQGWGKAADAVLTDVSEAFGSAITQWIQGNESLGAALEKALAQYLAQIAGKAAVDAMYFTAWGIADLFWHPARAGADFAAAAEFAAIAGIAGGAARAMGGGRSGGSGGDTGSAPQIDTSQAATHPGASGQQQPSAVKVVPHFATGALISAPTLAMIGDSRSGGSAREGILPLDDPQAMSNIAGAIAAHMGGSAGTTIIVQGMISADHLNKFVRKVSRGVNRGTVRLQSNRSLRVLSRG